MNDQAAAEEAKSAPQAAVRPSKVKLAKVIPTDRVSFDKQMAVLRAYAAASGPEKKAVNNEQVSAVVNDLAASSISLCNPFFSDCGLLIAEGRKQRPADVVFDYLHAYEWSAESAALKLRPALIDSWAAKTLLPKLAFRQLSRDEAVQFLADESKAQKSHRRSLELLLDFLNAAGVIKADGNSVSKSNGSPASSDAETPRDDTGDSGKREREPQPQAPGDDVERFEIPIPGKDAAVITVPRNLDADDWDMLSKMIEFYIKRLRKEAMQEKSS